MSKSSNPDPTSQKVPDPTGSGSTTLSFFTKARKIYRHENKNVHKKLKTYKTGTEECI